MARTRAKGGATTASSKDSTTTTTEPWSSIYDLPAESENPPKLFVLPKNASPAARIVTLQHPRYGRPARFLVCPEAGFFEFTTVSPSQSSPRSWLVQPDRSTVASGKAASLCTQTIQSPALHLATPYDPLFLLLPALCGAPTITTTTTTTTGRDQERQGQNEQEEQSQQRQQKKRLFLSLDDHLDATADPSGHLADLLASCPATRRRVEARLAAVCDAVPAGDETMYRVSEAKLARELLAKAKRIVGEEASKLPASMEERFVRRELEPPVLGVRIARGTGSGSESGSGSGTATPASSSSEGESQESSVSSASSAETAASSGSEESTKTTTSTAATSVAADSDEGDGVATSATGASDEVVRLQRLRVAFSFICSRYVSPAIAAMLNESLSKFTELVDFRPLDDYLERLAKLRQEAAAARSADFSRKRATDEEQDARAEKRRKQEAEEKARKANMSRGVRNLMKVDTSGMKKMSDFFKKKT
ncbi:hypothetical protein MYCTH_2306825 [Thermothelomyces thermophilus ATCC 42464]|uniref:Ribonuclease H2 subunit B n=1 Tax=Thermothelomyces thermophilus (strain ATCC 42464 / BCRC 31852 / DSM 1799) TaxID=573729 RepID=G2QEV9_THET4|nr:uncharacterized protein MYCTH_2306825 [Thermothelomyces thermophilus ATCC 42464]AEO58988.1 hypothetical protein MYCTH_2306825 [Thermothelomyces thermophilus ATCC 42464]